MSGRNYIMSINPKLIIEQLEEALEEREGIDRRKENKGADPVSGNDRRTGYDRRKDAQKKASE